jgi:hypothetical protein
MQTIEYLPKTTLGWGDLRVLGMQSRRGRCVEATASTPTYVVKYLANIRNPSHQWPLSHARALLTQRFARMVVKHDPEFAVRIGIASR